MPERLNSTRRQADREAGVLPVGTLVLWAACAGVGLIGLFFPRGRPPPVVVVAQPTEAELLNVEAVNPLPEKKSNAPSAPAEESAPPESAPVAAPSPAIAFSVPTQTPVHIVAAPRADTPTVVSTRPSVIQLTFGEGEGEQPAPEYPPEAVIDGQEGTVIVRLTVDEDGRVSNAFASTPSPWPLLNSAAVRAVRDTWRFRRGAARAYEVSIQFKLNRHQ